MQHKPELSVVDFSASSKSVELHQVLPDKLNDQFQIAVPLVILNLNEMFIFTIAVMLSGSLAHSVRVFAIFSSRGPCVVFNRF